MFFRRFVGAIGRILISVVFIISALNKVFNWDEVLEGVITNLNEWLFYGVYYPWLDQALELMMDFAPPILAVVTALELVGGISLLLGIRPRVGAGLIILFLIPTTFFYHPFWFFYGDEREVQLMMFLKNCAIIGGLLHVTSIGRVIKKSEILDAISRSNS
ncbi:MAG: DoxX family protein [Candidatus Algichlamydia australiensis]|nr:DoxX family protein [Chlamydiales bacterium]